MSVHYRSIYRQWAVMYVQWVATSSHAEGRRAPIGPGLWPADGLVFTTRTGWPIEPQALGRRFDLRCAKAGVRRICIRDTRRTCGSLLAVFDVHRLAWRTSRWECRGRWTRQSACPVGRPARCGSRVLDAGGSEKKPYDAFSLVSSSPCSMSLSLNVKLAHDPGGRRMAASGRGIEGW